MNFIAGIMESLLPAPEDTLGADSLRENAQGNMNQSHPVTHNRSSLGGNSVNTYSAYPGRGGHTPNPKKRPDQPLQRNNASDRIT